MGIISRRLLTKFRLNFETYKSWWRNCQKEANGDSVKVMLECTKKPTEKELKQNQKLKEIRE